MNIKRLAVILLLMLMGAWAVLVNQQPFFLEDTSAYVREPDFAVVHALGARFATEWTQPRTLEGAEGHPQAQSLASKSPIRLNDPFHKATISGRSIFYGGMLYLSYVISDFWSAIALQDAVFVYLCYVVAIECLGFPFWFFVATTIGIVILSPISFYIGFLMPDIFASYAILSATVLIAFWKRLSVTHRTLCAAIAGYSVLVHTSHLAVLAGLVAVAAATRFVLSLIRKPAGNAKAPVAALLAIFLIGCLGEIGSYYGINHVVGAPPIRPPFLMARMIADGPGYQYLKDHCGEERFVVCRFLSRLPLTSDYFLWSPYSRNGVFAASDPATRRALSNEQFSFALAVLKSNPLGVFSAAAKDFLRQLTLIGVNVFSPSTEQLSQFAGNLPETFSKGMVNSVIYANRWVLSYIGIWYAAFYYVALFVMLAALAIEVLGLIGPRYDGAWLYVLCLSGAGLLLNAAVCGVFSEPTPRYQTRVSWLAISIAILWFSDAIRVLSRVSDRRAYFRERIERIPRAVRFLVVGLAGLLTDIGLFTMVTMVGSNLLFARLISMTVATAVTWRLNRVLTFNRSGRQQHEEAIRYGAVTMTAAAVNYGIFTVLVLTVLGAVPQVAIIIAAAVAAFVSYNGHRVFSFAPVIHPNSVVE